ncbi:MAG: septum site-determining protein MinC [Aquificaceae bacterium]
MIELKGVTIPVVQVNVKSRVSVEELVSFLREKLSGKLFDGFHILIKSDGHLSQEELSRVYSQISLPSVLSREAKDSQRLLILHQILRAGTKIEHNGDILVLGDVNKDAQLIATGNIIVIGRLRGVAFAGALGDESCVVVSTIMEPQHIRIGKKIAIMDDLDRMSPGYPEMARVEGDGIILEKV